MSVVSKLFNVRRRFAVIIPLAVMACLATPALPANATTSPSADLATTITAHGTNVQGGYIGYTITVTNNGPDAASGVFMTDHIPASMWSRYPTIFYCVGSVASVGTPGWCGPLPSSVSCTTPPVGSTGTVSCTTSSLASGASMTIEMAIRVGFYFSSQLVQDTAAATSSTFDPNAANNTATVAVGHTGPIG